MSVKSNDCSYTYIDAEKFQDMLLNKNDEFTILDIRENGVFADAHIFSATSLPLSHLECRILTLVPRLETTIVLIGSGPNDTLTKLAADRLGQWRYSNILILRGGMEDWVNKGYPVFSGVHVPSKAFGEFAEYSYKTPSIGADTLQAWLKDNKDLILVDCRPYAEYHLSSVPGAICCPGMELPYRIFSLPRNVDTPIVITCAGRTRGIIGTQTLIEMGISNPVVVLENGMAGWYLNGGKLLAGQNKIVPPPTHEGLNQAMLAARRIADRFEIEEIDERVYKEYVQETSKTLYILDVRTPEEYAAGHLPGSRSAPGGQLIQATDFYVGVRNARLLLVDDDGVRARFTAAWLRQMGWHNVAVLRLSTVVTNHGYEVGKEPEEWVCTLPNDIPLVSPFALYQIQNQGEGVVVVDLASSLDYREQHIPGSVFATRSALNESLSILEDASEIVLTCPDGLFSQLAWQEVTQLVDVPVHVLQGGTTAWKAAGLPLSNALEVMKSSPGDVWYSPYDRADKREAMQEYLDWEVELLDRIKKEPSADFWCKPKVS